MIHLVGCFLAIWHVCTISDQTNTLLSASLKSCWLSKYLFETLLGDYDSNEYAANQTTGYTTQGFLLNLP